MVFSRKPKSSLFYVMPRFHSSCSPALGNSMSSSALIFRTISKPHLSLSLSIYIYVCMKEIIWILFVLLMMSIRTKAFFDLYQKTTGTDLWISHYEVISLSLESLLARSVSFSIFSSYILLVRFVCFARKCKKTTEG